MVVEDALNKSTNMWFNAAIEFLRLFALEKKKIHLRQPQREHTNRDTKNFLYLIGSRSSMDFVDFFFRITRGEKNNTIHNNNNNKIDNKILVLIKIALYAESFTVIFFAFFFYFL